MKYVAPTRKREGFVISENCGHIEVGDTIFWNQDDCVVTWVSNNGIELFNPYKQKYTNLNQIQVDSLMV